jgi:hypothetical protein
MGKTALNYLDAILPRFMEDIFSAATAGILPRLTSLIPTGHCPRGCWGLLYRRRRPQAWCLAFGYSETTLSLAPLAQGVGAAKNASFRRLPKGGIRPAEIVYGRVCIGAFRWNQKQRVGVCGLSVPKGHGVPPPLFCK